jgi:hypothetical protein
MGPTFEPGRGSDSGLRLVGQVRFTRLLNVGGLLTTCTEGSRGFWERGQGHFRVMKKVRPSLRDRLPLSVGRRTSGLYPCDNVLSMEELRRRNVFLPVVESPEDTQQENFFFPELALQSDRDVMIDRGKED